MSQTLPPIRSIWLGRPFSTVERLCIQSFLSNGHPFHLYCYTDIQNVPEGTTVLDAREILPESAIFRSPEGWGKGSYAPFADLFRFTLLSRHGGWWVDMDMVCIRPIETEQQRVVATSDERGHGILPNINALRFPAGDPLLDRILDKFKRREPEYLMGVKSMQETIAEEQDHSLLAAPEIFNPIGWRFARYLVRPVEPFWHPRAIRRSLGFTPPIGGITGKTLMLHLWNEIWTQNGYDRDAQYHPDSLFEQLKRKYLR